MDYSKLRDLLKEGKWREAEDETRELLIQAAGKGAVKRGWVYFTEVKFIPGEHPGSALGAEHIPRARLYALPAQAHGMDARPRRARPSLRPPPPAFHQLFTSP